MRMTIRMLQGLAGLRMPVQTRKVFSLAGEGVAGLLVQVWLPDMYAHMTFIANRILFKVSGFRSSKKAKATAVTRTRM
jgi:hypothetical protein